MRLTLNLFGLELDVTFGPADAPSPAPDEDDGGRDLGYTTATPIGFVAAFEVPDFVPGVDRNTGWGDEGNRL